MSHPAPAHRRRDPTPRRQGPGPRPVLAAVLVLLLGACGGAARPAAGPVAEVPSPPSTAATDTGTERPGAATSPPEPTAEPLELTLAFGGDLLPHLPVVRAAEGYGATTGMAADFGPMLAPLAPVLSEADLALCHLEVPLVADGQAVTGYPSFRAPRELAAAVAGAGYDGCSTASNHSLDGGLAGIGATLDTFDLVGLGHTGTARGPEEAASTRTYDVAGARIAHLSYSYGFNGIPLPDGAPWAANLLHPVRMAADARAARAAGADLVVVSLHWGSEYRAEPDALQSELAPVIGGFEEVDLVIGHHAHVVQPVERVGGTWVVYGLGNQLSNQAQDERRDGLTVVVTVGGTPGAPFDVRAVEAVPTWVDLASYQVLPIPASLARADLHPSSGPTSRPPCCGPWRSSTVGAPRSSSGPRGDRRLGPGRGQRRRRRGTGPTATTAGAPARSRAASRAASTVTPR